MSYRDVALDAFQWVAGRARPSAGGIEWPDEVNGGSVEDDGTLYRGVAGVAHAFLAAYACGHGQQFEQEARSGIAHMRCTPPEEPGLFIGRSGYGFVFMEAHRLLRDAGARDEALDVVKHLEATAHEAPGGIEWGSCTDVIEGTSGIGLFLLCATRWLRVPRALELAERAASRLAALAIEQDHGAMWHMDPSTGDRWPEMPNFSHGTAGVAFFLAAVATRAARDDLLDSAKQGASYLLSIANTDDGVCEIAHDPGETDNVHLGWCHGPAGLAWLWLMLARATKDERWVERARASVRAIERREMPAGQALGFWNDSSLCCGAAGIGELLLDMHRLTGEEAYLEGAVRLGDRIVRRARMDDRGTRWPIRPLPGESREVARTGLMSGASGIALFLLRLDARLRGIEAASTLPHAVVALEHD